jgi:pimeloyl-ACP methyl ester carboxylesterase
METQLNGARIAFCERGARSGRTLLLIHGFPFDHRMWQAQLAGLQGQAHIIAPDLRGFGQSQVTPGPLTMEQHADDLAALLAHLAVERAVVAGLSMGGYIAFAFWRRHAARVQALALLDTRAEPDSPQTRANREATAARVREAGPTAIARDMLPRLLASSSLADPHLSGRVLNLMAQQPAEGIIGALAGLRDREDSRPTLPTIRAPALVLVGEHDALTPPADAATMVAALPNARLVVAPRAGHLSPLENPAAVNRALRAFLREVAPD